MGPGRLVRLPSGAAHLIGSQPVTIGREPSSDIPVHNEDVSRQHAYVLRTPQGFLLVDSSLHGTYVNGERVQAQRILVDGDVLDIGDQSFRFDQPSAAPPMSLPDVVGSIPMTTEHRRSYRSVAGATGKMGLAVSLDGRTSWKTRLRIWIKRYGVSELAGIGMAFGGSWLMASATGNPIATAYGAAVGEALGFYGSLVTREMIQEAYVAGSRREPFGVREIIRTWRGLLLEFGPAELLDTGLLRPLAMGVGIVTVGPALGIVAGKLLADVAFYLPVILIYEHRRKVRSA